MQTIGRDWQILTPMPLYENQLLDQIAGGGHLWLTNALHFLKHSNEYGDISITKVTKELAREHCDIYGEHVSTWQRV